MLNLPILESFLDKPIVAGYTLRQIFEYWWLGLIILIVAAVALVATYFLLAWLFGRMKFQDGDKEKLSEYKQAPKEEKKTVKEGASKPVKNVITWRKMAPWFIPVVCVGALILSAAASFLPSATFSNLLFTLTQKEPIIYDTPTSREAAAEAENNVVAIEEEGIVLLKNTHNSLPLKAKEGEEKIKVNIFGACAYGLFYGNGGSGSFQTDGRVKSFPRIAKKLEVAMMEEGFEINQNLYNFVKNYYNGGKVSIAESDYDIQCGFDKYGYTSEVAGSKAPYAHEAPITNYTDTKFEIGGEQKTLLEDALEFSDTAIFCITRRGSEDEDSRYSNSNLNDTSDAGLTLTAKEQDIIGMLEDNFKNVIILLNVPTVIEAEFLDDSEIDSAVFIGHPGLTGTKAVAEVLNGKVNPSGHLVDTWPYDVKSAPSYQNFGNDTTLPYTSGAARGAKFTNYQEGIYVGYRYLR